MTRATPYYGGAARNHGGTLARFVNFHAHANQDAASLRADHPALVNGTTQFPTRVFDAADVPRILVSGHNSAKVGAFVTKGDWRGMSLFTLTLEERATCPRSCHLWSECYGNAMPLARRVDVGGAFTSRLGDELRAKAEEFPGGFIVRLHVLGDFFSAAYVDQWSAWLAALPEIHVFGYTAHRRGTEIGGTIERMNAAHPVQCAIRFSVPPDDAPGPLEATTIWRQPETAVVPEGHVCPVSLGQSDACGTCALCWSPSMRGERIVFVGHGMNRRGRKHR